MADETPNRNLQVGQGECTGHRVAQQKRSSDCQNAQDAVSLKDTPKHRGKLSLGEGCRPFSCVCVLKDRLGRVIPGSSMEGAGSKGGVLPGMSRRHTHTHTHRPTTWTCRQIAAGSVLTCRGHLGFGARRTVGQEKSFPFGTAICQRSPVVPKGGF